MPASDPLPPFNPSTQELVLLVHGTFANNASKSRSDHLHWWQAGGEVWNKIDEQLPEQLHVASDPRTEVFSWSGDNSERDRRAGGRELFKHLQKLEKKGTRYHLVGHSHGGSVIWHCLLESVKRRLQFHRKVRLRRRKMDQKMSLPGLRSFTTIGTPFLQLDTPVLRLNSARLLGQWLGQKVDWLIDRTIGRMIGRLTPWLWMSGLIVSLTILGSMLQVYPKVDEFLTAWNVSFDGWWKTVLAYLKPDHHPLLVAILNDNVAGPLAGLLLTLTAFLSMVMWAWASAVQLEATAVREGVRIRNEAFVKFGKQWLGIWSRHDEAINGLRATLKLSGNIAPRIEVSSDIVFDYDHRMDAYRKFARWFVAPIFNLIISRPGDGMIWRSVSRGIQGNDRPGCIVSDVSPGPIVPKEIEWQQLPESYDDRLVEASNKCLIDRSQVLLPQLREVLSQLAWSRPDQLSLLLANETSFEGNELVHTSYFQESAVLKAIACQIQHHSKLKGVRPDPKKSTTRWCDRFRRKADSVSNDRKFKAAALPLLGERNGQAIGGLLLSLVMLVGFMCCGELIRQINEYPISMRYGLNESQVTTVVLAAGLVFTGVTTLLTRSGIRRAKRGAAWPRVSRWGWRIARIALVLYLVVVGLAVAELSPAQLL